MNVPLCLFFVTYLPGDCFALGWCRVVHVTERIMSGRISLCMTVVSACGVGCV